MTAFAADDFAAINARRREIRREEKRPDDDLNTASGADLEAIAASLDVWRTSAGESDYALRQRAQAERRKRMGVA